MAGIGLGVPSPSVVGMPIKLYRLLCELVNLGRCDVPLAVAFLLPFVLNIGRCMLDLDFREERVVGGEDLPRQELSVEEDCSPSFPSPSLLDVPDEAPFSVSVALENFDRRRRLRSLRKEGIAAKDVECERSRRYENDFDTVCAV